MTKDKAIEALSTKLVDALAFPIGQDPTTTDGVVSLGDIDCEFSAECMELIREVEEAR